MNGTFRIWISKASALQEKVAVLLFEDEFLPLSFARSSGLFLL